MSDSILKLDFESQATHTIIYDPNEEKKSMSGRNGEFEVVRVVENGRPWYLSLSNQSLLRQLVTIDKISQLEITRTGASYDTKYQVKNHGSPTVQAKVNK